MTLRTILLVPFLIIFLGRPLVVSGGSVFFYMPVVTRSIRLTFMPVANEMARKGHEVVILTQHPDKNPIPNITEITIEGKIMKVVSEKMSEDVMKEGASTSPPLMDFVEAQVAVSCFSKSCRKCYTCIKFPTEGILLRQPFIL